MLWKHVLIYFAVEANNWKVILSQGKCRLKIYVNWVFALWHQAITMITNSNAVGNQFFFLHTWYICCSSNPITRQCSESISSFIGQPWSWCIFGKISKVAFRRKTAFIEGHFSFTLKYFCKKIQICQSHIFLPVQWYIQICGLSSKCWAPSSREWQKIWVRISHFYHSTPISIMWVSHENQISFWWSNQWFCHTI